MLSTRIFSVIFFVICVCLAFVATGINAELSYEPLGPKPFPLWTLIILAVNAVILFFFAEKTNVAWPNFSVFKRMFALLVGFVIFASIFEYLGFIVASIFVIFVISLVFGARVHYAAIVALVCGFALFYLFNELLQVTLPLGEVFGN